MKIRTDFVTNSSSSSFIISYKKVEIENKNDYIKMLERVMEKVVGNNFINTEEKLQKYYMKCYGFGDLSFDELLEDDEYLKIKYMRYLNRINEGHTVYFVSTEYDEAEFYYSLKDIDENLIVECDD